jgi:hypothetical protein
MKTDSSHAGALVGGTLLIVFGLLSLASQLFRSVVNWSYLWPLSVIIFGGLFFAGMFWGGRRVSGLAIPGTIIGGIGLMLLYQNLTNQWESWAYSWSLIIVLVGIGIYIAGAYGRFDGQKQAGIRVMKIGLILFVIFGAFFEMIFSMDQSLGLRGILFPALLILLGAYLIVRRLGIVGGVKSDDSNPPSTQDTSPDVK